MNRREWLKSAIAAAVGVAVAPAPVPVTPAVTVAAPAAAAPVVKAEVDIIKIITENMLRDIQFEEDRRFLAYIDSVDDEELEDLYAELYAEDDETERVA